MASADVTASVGKARAVENSIALRVHEMYYRILIGETRRRALQARIRDFVAPTLRST